MRIIVTGTPGVGKTTLSKSIAAKYNLKHIDVSLYIIENKLYTCYDKKDDTHDFDIDTIIDHIDKSLNTILGSSFSGVVIDTHSPELCEDFYFDFIFVVKGELKSIRRRLTERGYKEQKILDNLECEIMKEIFLDCEEIFGDEKVVSVGNSEREVSKDELMNQVVSYIENRLN